MRRWCVTVLIMLLTVRPTLAFDSNAMPAARITPSTDGGSISLSGPIGRGTARAFAEVAMRLPQLRLLRLDSPGGFVDEARAIAALTRRLDLDTYVSHLCASACAQVFYAGRDRFVRPEARLGFHSYGTLKDHSASVAEIMAAENVERRSYARGGLAEWFVDRIFETPNNRIWVPTTQEMLAARFVTRVTLADDPVPSDAPPGMPHVNHPVALAGQVLPTVIGP